MSAARTSPQGAPPAEGVAETVPQIKPEILHVPRLELCVEREAGKPTDRIVVLDKDFVRVGAHPDNELVIADRQVSRSHCTLERCGAGFRVTDAGSLNGTWIGGARIRDAEILADCAIRLGESTIRVRDARTLGEREVAPMVIFGDLIGASLPMRRLFQLLHRVAQSASDVLIEGENGTGKELIAAELVHRSSRSKKPLIIVDCGAISPTLIESELFGHVRGAFTGAMRDRAGAFEEADGGTVFLDEIGELPLDMQPKLLRALAQREIRRVGATRGSKVDLRVIAATNRRLEREVNSGRFREDLYYRLSVVTLRVPPLRERKEDIPLLVSHFLDKLGVAEPASVFSPEALEELKRYDWPGNVRELKNHVERVVVLGGDVPLVPPSGDASRASERLRVDIERPFKEAKESVVERFERAYLTALLEWADGNVSRAARKAGLDRMYLHRLLQRYGMRRGAALDA
jgi:transcriptional regulator with GAF, ATPase, and Fis domain